MNHRNAAVPVDALCCNVIPYERYPPLGWFNWLRFFVKRISLSCSFSLRAREKWFSLYMYVCVYLSTYLYFHCLFFVYASIVCICKVFSLGTWHLKEPNVAQRQISSWRHGSINKYRFPPLGTLDNWTIIDCRTGNQYPWLQNTYYV